MCLKNKIDILVKKITSTKNPSIIASDIMSFNISLIRDEQISLYEAFMLNGEAIKFERLAYTQLSWKQKVNINTCLIILNQKLLADVFDEKEYSKKLKQIALEASLLYKLKNSHYIMNKYLDFFEDTISQMNLLELQEYRDNINDLDYDEGPYHFECFPYLFYNPESILLSEIEKGTYINNKNLSPKIEELIVQLNLL